jgi:hypothetical protein
VLDTITQIARFVIFNSNFSLLRKTYMPQAGKGSQSSDFKLVVKLNAASAAYVRRKRRSWL